MGGGVVGGFVREADGERRDARGGYKYCDPGDGEKSGSGRRIVVRSRDEGEYASGAGGGEEPESVRQTGGPCDRVVAITTVATRKRFSDVVGGGGASRDQTRRAVHCRLLFMPSDVRE